MVQRKLAKSTVRAQADRPLGQLASMRARYKLELTAWLQSKQITGAIAAPCNVAGADYLLSCRTPMASFQMLQLPKSLER